MRRTVLSTFLFVAILGLGCTGVAVSAKAYGHCEDANDPQYDPNECEQKSGGNSLDKAINFTAKSNASFVKFRSLPKKLSDILAILNETTEEDEARLARLISRANEPPPSSKEELTEFYLRRAFAASSLARNQHYLRLNETWL